MSLVERALQKLQQTSPRVAVPAGSAAEVQVAVQAPPARPVAPGPLGQPLAMNVVALRSAGLLPPQAEEHQLAQQYRRVKRPLIANAIGRGAPRVQGGQLIMVTSALPGEGKTFTSLNLALSMSIDKDVHVVLVDADVAKPHISRLLGVSESEGLLDALRNAELDMERLIRPTDVPNLAILPAGTQSSEATELLASARMGQVTAALAEHDHQRIVVFDSPPLLHTTESHALAQSMGQVVVVVRAESTAQPVVLDALKLLEGHRAVSLVLNQSVKSASTAYYYRYGEGSDAAAER
ncbi:MAG TPA: AAA family ATPase [Steroidobacteraceae bacterium]|nr:AAA family ATPase [Steroidobacteraceae bacterium]